LELRGLVAVAILALKPLQVLQLCSETFAEVASAHTDRIHLPYQVNGFAQGITAEEHVSRLGARRHQRRTRERWINGLRLLGTNSSLCFCNGDIRIWDFGFRSKLRRRSCCSRRGRPLRSGVRSFRRLRVRAQWLLRIGQTEQLIV